MGLIMAYDTETTGLPDWKSPSNDPSQPHIVQAAAILIDEDTRKHVASFDQIVRPDGWEIPDEVAKVHGITTEHALDVGIPEWLLIEQMLEFSRVAAYRIAHNESFDMRIVRIGLKRFRDDQVADEWKAQETECTARMSTPILKLPPTERMLAANRRHPKAPNLGEAYEFFTGRKLEGAHSAMVDVLACVDVYWAIRDGHQSIGKEPGKPETPKVDDVSFL